MRRIPLERALPCGGFVIVLRTCMWIFFLALLMILSLALVLGIGCLFFAVDTPNVSNQFVKNVEFWKAMVMEPSLMRYDFSPSPFCFSETNIVYELEFAPRHPFLHEMSISYRCPDNFHSRHDRICIPNQKISLDMEILHGGEVYRKWHIGDIATRCERSVHDPNGKVEHYFGRFNVAEFPWHYKDCISVRVRLLAPATKDSFLTLVKYPMTVQELHPHAGL